MGRRRQSHKHPCAQGREPWEGKRGVKARGRAGHGALGRQGDCASPRAPPGGVAGTAYMARMLFSGRRGISRTLVLDRMASWLVVETVLPVMRWTW